MKDIIIVGTSKAGYLHTNAYNKISNKGEIYYVDINGKINNPNIKAKKAYCSIKEAIINEKIDVKNVIVDICIPKEEFYNVIEQCIRLNINNIIVEKPFIATNEFFSKYDELNIIMIQNYLYSKITNEIKKIINDNNYNIKSIYTNFSKNRIEESISRRGMSNKITQNFEVEIPHQIYLANYLLGTNAKTQIILKEQNDLYYNNLYLEKHGYGKIILKQDEKIIIHESDLCTNNIIKQICIICEDGILINAKFVIYDKQLNKIQNGKLTITKYDNIIFEKEYEEDDNMFYCIKEYYEYFNNCKITEKYKNRILEFSEIFGKLIEDRKEIIKQ